MDEEKVIAEFERGPGQKVVIRRTQFKGREYLDIRQFFEGDDGQWLPTKKGVAVPWELRQQMLGALQEAQHEDG
ncbi:MAG: transcriptional coactivator p15/PC4 family protein [Candidatus Bipolaricaulota bacterium]